MSASFNQVTLLGNVTRDIQVRYIEGGTAVCEVGLAINEKYKNKAGTLVEKAVFVDITLWGRLAEVAGEYLRRGAPCLISGKLALDQWEDRESGQKRSKLKVVGESLQLLGSKKDSADQSPSQYAGGDSQTPPAESHNGFDGTREVDPNREIPF
jgi:single-strand DNA-binding protein